MNRISVAFSLLCILCCCTTFLAFDLQDCGSKLGKFGGVSISTCDTSDDVCALIRGGDLSASLKFTPNQDISHVEVRLYGVILGIPVPWPMKKPDACQDIDSGVKCPLQKDQESEYKTTMSIDKAFPPLGLDIMWELANDKNETIVCVKFPAKLK